MGRGGNKDMDHVIFDMAAGLIAILLFLYLIAAVLRPEKF